MKTVSLDTFLDRKKVIRAADAANRRNLSKAGAFIRTTARHSIRKRKAASPPGSPPSSHTGLLKRFIFFGYDAARKTAVVGPMRLNQKVGDAPAAHEHGGATVVIEGSRRSRRRRRRVRIKARPFMGPGASERDPEVPEAMGKQRKGIVEYGCLSSGTGSGLS